MSNTATTYVRHDNQTGSDVYVAQRWMIDVVRLRRHPSGLTVADHTVRDNLSSVHLTREDADAAYHQLAADPDVVAAVLVAWTSGEMHAAHEGVLADHDRLTPMDRNVCGGTPTQRVARAGCRPMRIYHNGRMVREVGAWRDLPGVAGRDLTTQPGPGHAIIPDSLTDADEVVVRTTW